MIDMKVCRKCKIEKPLLEFDKSGWKKIDGTLGLKGNCKECCKLAVMAWRGNDPDGEKKRQAYKRTKKWKKKNIELVRQYHEEYNIIHIEQNRERQRDHRRINSVRINQVTKLRRKKNRLQGISPKLKLAAFMSGGIWKSLKGKKARRTWQSLVNYTTKQLREHLEAQFVDGMSWDNYGEWHVDHIIPKSFFQFAFPDDVEFRMCWRFENLRPLWARDNQIKGNKLVKVA